jgi:hypothetical protein
MVKNPTFPTNIPSTRFPSPVESSSEEKLPPASGRQVDLLPAEAGQVFRHRPDLPSAASEADSRRSSPHRLLPVHRRTALGHHERKPPKRFSSNPVHDSWTTDFPRLARPSRRKTRPSKRIGTGLAPTAIPFRRKVKLPKSA